MNLNQSFATSFSLILRIDSFSKSSAWVNCQFIFMPAVFLITNFFSLAKYFSIGANSGIYGGMNANLHGVFLVNETISLFLYILVLSRIIKAMFKRMLYSFFINWQRCFNNFRNNDESTEPVVLIAKTFPFVDIAVIKDFEIMNSISFNSVALPFFDHEYIALVCLEKDDSSTFIITSNWESMWKNILLQSNFWVNLAFSSQIKQGVIVLFYTTCLMISLKSLLHLLFLIWFQNFFIKDLQMSSHVKGCKVSAI